MADELTHRMFMGHSECTHTHTHQHKIPFLVQFVFVFLKQALVGILISSFGPQLLPKFHTLSSSVPTCSTLPKSCNERTRPQENGFLTDCIMELLSLPQRLVIKLTGIRDTKQNLEGGTYSNLDGESS